MRTEESKAREQENLPARAASRRSFAKTLAGAAAAPFLAGALPLPTGTPGNSPPSPAATPAPSPFVEAMAEAMRLRFGSRLPADQLAEAKEALGRMSRNADRLRRVRLTNADEPDVVFFAAVRVVSGAD
ncbi:MAG: hypothetical protein ACM3JH_09245 [Acidithiobacillales bacterium]